MKKLILWKKNPTMIGTLSCDFFFNERMIDFLSLSQAQSAFNARVRRMFLEWSMLLSYGGPVHARVGGQNKL